MRGDNMANERIDKGELLARRKWLDNMKSLGADIWQAENNILDHVAHDDFIYMAQRSCLMSSAITVDHLPMLPSGADAKARKRMNNLFHGFFTGVKGRSTEDLFKDCADIRAKLNRLSELNEAELILVSNDLDSELMVRRYAEAIIEGDVKQLNEILNQAMGKPIERVMVASKKVDPLADLTPAELRKLIGDGK
jgi:hypothetical protein